MANTSKQSNLLGVLANTYLRFNQLEDEQTLEQQIFWGSDFPAEMAAQLPTADTDLSVVLHDSVLQKLCNQDVQPSWCLVQLLPGWVFVMHSEADQRTLLEWMPKDEGNPLAAEAKQQDRFVQVSDLFLNPT